MLRRSWSGQTPVLNINIGADELSTGHRQLWRKIAVSDPVGATGISPESITPDENLINGVN
jgi:hypothetical protein